jgi:hypothetical protein
MGCNSNHSWTTANQWFHPAHNMPPSDYINKCHVPLWTDLRLMYTEVKFETLTSIVCLVYTWIALISRLQTAI